MAAAKSLAQARADVEQAHIDLQKFIEWECRNLELGDIPHSIAVAIGKGHIRTLDRALRDLAAAHGIRKGRSS